MSLPLLLALSSLPSPTGELEFSHRALYLGDEPLRLIVAPLDFGPTSDVALVLRKDIDTLVLATLEGQGDGALEPVQRMLLEQLGYTNDPSFASVDMNIDGAGDLAVTSTTASSFFLGDGTLVYESDFSLPTYGGIQYGVGFTDVNDDGLLDSALLVDDFGWFLDVGYNTGTGLFSPAGFVYAPSTADPDSHLLFADLFGGVGRQALQSICIRPARASSSVSSLAFRVFALRRLRISS